MKRPEQQEYINQSTGLVSRGFDPQVTAMQIAWERLQFERLREFRTALGADAGIVEYMGRGWSMAQCRTWYLDQLARIANGDEVEPPYAN